MLDGGGSTQCIFPEGNIYSSRIVATVVLFWEKGVKTEPVKNEPPAAKNEVKCPYMEPTRLIKRGSIGAGSKWVQWQLNRHGSSLDVDGDFGKLSVNALIAFQKKKGLDADGICGPATRAALKL
jgi:peptidoglycan hydrolase-like protein with peptidoglycan-binding domain